MAKKATQNKPVTTTGTKMTQKRASRTKQAPATKATTLPAKKRGRPSKSEPEKTKKVTTTAPMIQYTGVDKAGKQKVLTVGKGDTVSWGSTSKAAEMDADYAFPGIGEYFFIDGIAYKILDRSCWNASLGWR